MSKPDRQSQHGRRCGFEIDVCFFPTKGFSFSLSFDMGGNWQEMPWRERRDRGREGMPVIKSKEEEKERENENKRKNILGKVISTKFPSLVIREQQKHLFSF